MIKTSIYSKAGIRLFLIWVSALFAFSGTGFAQTKKRVDILNCDTSVVTKNVTRLLKNVQIRVDNALMWCDSMYSYNDRNMVDAFGRVHIIRGDTLNMYADFINYNSDTKLAKARRNVRLIDKTVTLTTDSLDYSMTTDMAWYNYSGTVKDSTNVLNSLIGVYHVNEKKANFRTNIVGTTKDYKIKSDTLIYFTDTKKVYIEGPTYIYNEKDTLYAEYGWYNSMTNYANLTKNPRIWNANQKVKADSIFYDKPKGQGLALGHARIQDIENKIIVVGNRVEYNDITKIAFATDSAMLIQYSETDSLFLHADILRTMPDTSTVSKKSVPVKTVSKLLSPKKAMKDSITSDVKEIVILKTDSLSNDSLAVKALIKDTTATKKPKDARLVLAYHKVRFFREDFQGKCDSLAYWSKDSTIQMFTSPVIWSDNNQITANYIEMINRSKDPDEIRMKDDAFIISMEADSIRFNQIKGKNMTGFVRNNELYKIDVNGNGESNYYAYDKKGIIGLNSAKSSNITLYLSKGKVVRIALIKSPEGELKPMAEIQEADKQLPGFKWQQDIRPRSKKDIFRTSDSIISPVTKNKQGQENPPLKGSTEN